MSVLDPITVVLVGCGESKAKRVSPAKDLYTSRLFKMARAWAETCDEWRIVSARYGLVAPDTKIAPYDDRLKKADATLWGLKVANSLIGEFLDFGPFEVVILAGAMYADAIRAGLAVGNGFRADCTGVREPLRGLGIGERLHWFAEQHRLESRGAA